MRGAFKTPRQITASLQCTSTSQVPFVSTSVRKPIYDSAKSDKIKNVFAVLSKRVSYLEQLHKEMVGELTEITEKFETISEHIDELLVTQTVDELHEPVASDSTTITSERVQIVELLDSKMTINCIRRSI